MIMQLFKGNVSIPSRPPYDTYDRMIYEEMIETYKTIGLMQTRWKKKKKPRVASVKKKK